MSTTTIPESFRQFWAGVEIESVDGSVQPFGRVAAWNSITVSVVSSCIGWSGWSSPGMRTAKGRPGICQLQPG